MFDSSALQRRLYVHPAHQTTGVATGLAAMPEHNPFGSAIAEQPCPLNVCLIRPLERRLDESLVRLQAYFEEHHHVRSTQVFAQPEDDLPDLLNLEVPDCLLLVAPRTDNDNEPAPHIEQFGGAMGVVAVTPADCELDKGTEVTIVEPAKAHPLLAGVEPFTSHGDLCRNPTPAGDAVILLTGSCLGHEQPVAWLQVRDTVRVFRTSLGHPDDFRQQSFLRLLANAVTWASGQET